MPSATTVVPLLPLPAVLFPGTFLPVRVDNHPHRALLRDCVDAGHHLGVVLNPGEAEYGRAPVPCTTGCLASVALLVHGDEDDSISAILYGEHRMRVLDFMPKADYLTGRIEMLKDYPGQHVDRRSKEVLSLFHEYLDIIRRRYQADITEVNIPKDPAMISYLLASILQLPLDIKQRWLESDSTTDRLEEEVAFLRAEVEKQTIFLSLSERLHQQYRPVDPYFYTALISQN